MRLATFPAARVTVPFHILIENAAYPPSFRWAEMIGCLRAEQRISWKIPGVGEDPALTSRTSGQAALGDMRGRASSSQESFRDAECLPWLGCGAQLALGTIRARVLRPWAGSARVAAGG